VDRREAYERRVWRLAWLLTGGREDLCARLVAGCLDAQPDLGRLDPAHVDRLVVLAARRRARGGPAVSEGAPPARRLLAAVAGLPPQLREAWVFTRIDGLGPMETARAMDCSKTAATRHLERADAELAERLGTELGSMLEALRAEADLAAPGAALAAFRAERRRRRRVRRSLLVFGGLALGLSAVMAWAAWRAAR
jgi:sigma-70-like protein